MKDELSFFVGLEIALELTALACMAVWFGYLFATQSIVGFL